METRVIKAVGHMPEDSEVMDLAKKIISEGGLCAIPTETVYGLAGNALDPSASEKIYEAKGRPCDNPLIVHIADTAALDHIARDIPSCAYDLAGKFWPGPLTMIFKKKPVVPSQTTGGLETVAVRMPSNPIAAEFISICGGYIAAPSANASGRPSCTKASHVLEDLNGKIPLIIDGGKVGIGLESTIIDLTSDIPCLLRPGFIDIDELNRILGTVDTDPAVFGVSSGTAPKAPGMKYRHYAPKGDLTIVSGEKEAVASYINDMTAKAKEKNLKAAVLCCTENAGLYNCPLVSDIGSIYNENRIAANLFSALREFDDKNVQIIYSEEFNTPRIGQAIMNRLTKASGNKIIRL